MSLLTRRDENVIAADEAAWKLMPPLVEFVGQSLNCWPRNSMKVIYKDSVLIMNE